MRFYVLFYFSEDMTDNYRKIINVVIMTSFEVIISTERPGNVPLSEYFSREVIALQDSVTGYESVGSSKTKLGNVTALEVSYIGSMVEEGTIYGQTKTMELVTIFQGVSYFFIYRAEISEHSKYLPAVQEMIQSFVFKRA